MAQLITKLQNTNKMTTKNETPKNDFNATIGNTVLCEVLLTNKLNNYENMEYRNASLKPKNQRITLG